MYVYKHVIRKIKKKQFVKWEILENQKIKETLPENEQGGNNMECVYNWKFTLCYPRFLNQHHMEIWILRANRLLMLYFMAVFLIKNNPKAFLVWIH